MAVAHDAASESHTGITGSVSQSSFSWTHTPVGTPRGVLVFTFTNSGSEFATAVTYGSASLTAVTGGSAVDASGEPGTCKAWFLGSSVPTGAQTVTVTRTNNTATLYAVAVTVTASADTDISGTPVTLINDGTFSEQTVGEAGVQSVGYAGANSGSSAPDAAGANSLALHNIDLGSRVIQTARSTSALTGTKQVGFTSSVADDRAAVHLAIKEVAGGGGPTPTRGLVSFAELETPTVATRARVSFAELQVPNLLTRGMVAWAELEAPTVATRGRVSFAELESPQAPTRGLVSWAEFSAPDLGATPTRGLASWAELEVPQVLTRGRVSWAELQTPNALTRGRASWAELEAPNAPTPTRARVAWAELQTPSVVTRALLTWAELQAPDVSTGYAFTGDLTTKFCRYLAALRGEHPGRDMNTIVRDDAANCHTQASGTDRNTKYDKYLG